MKFTKGMRILVIAAHPDDEVLGCGGTLAAAITAGAVVAVKFLGEGYQLDFLSASMSLMNFYIRPKCVWRARAQGVAHIGCS